MAAGWGATTAMMVADHIVSLAEMVRTIPPVHIARRAVEWGAGGTPRHKWARCTAAPSQHARAHACDHVLCTASQAASWEKAKTRSHQSSP
eukprot:12299618-Alexandrium_andersonii.AAC.1